MGGMLGGCKPMPSTSSSDRAVVVTAGSKSPPVRTVGRDAAESSRPPWRAPHIDDEIEDAVGAVRAAQENYRAETLEYLDVSRSLTDWYPAVPNGKPRSWSNPRHPQASLWQKLKPMLAEPVRIAMAVKAGPAGTRPAEPTTRKPMGWPQPVGEPWYVLQVLRCDASTGMLKLFVSSSMTTEIHAEYRSETCRGGS
jgi:hypothetical protein